MGFVKLSSAQVIKVHGLFPNSTLLTWNDVCTMKLTPSYLHFTLGLPKETLKKLQPDAKAWAATQMCTLCDCEALNAIPVNPIAHLGLTADCLTGYTQQQIHSFGVRYEEMLGAGLTPPLMILFHYTLQEWVALGLRVEHLEHIHADDVKILFGMDVPQCQDAARFMVQNANV